MGIIFTPLVTAGGIVLIAHIFAGIETDGPVPVLVASLVLALLNAFVKPVILFLTFPVNLLTLGLFSLLVNGALLWFAGALVDGFHVAGFFPAVAGAFVLSVIILISRVLLE